MGNLVFIPSYNDCKQAFRLYKQATTYPDVEQVLIIDDSDDPMCVNYYRTQELGTLKLIHGKRVGKWAAWTQALEIATGYDSLIQIDADIEIRDFTPIIDALENYDVVTAHVKFKDNNKQSWVAKKMIEIYRRSHEESRKLGRVNLGGQVIGLSKKAVKALLEYGFFEEPVIADDHVIALAIKSMGFKSTTVDCSVYIKLPGNTKDWILYKSRHGGAVRWAKGYVKSKINDNDSVEKTSRSDYWMTAKIFLKSCLKVSPIALILFFLITLVSLLPLDNKSKWKPLKSTKPEFLS